MDKSQDTEAVRPAPLEHERRAADAPQGLLAHAATSLGGGLLQRKLARRVVQRAPEDEADAAGRKGVAKDKRRQVITFIMGSGDPFYEEATKFWKQSGKTDVLVTTETTFSGVLAYLAANKADNGQPWAEINLVNHAHEDGTMNVQYDAKSDKGMNQKDLQEKIDSGQVKGLDNAIVDKKTSVNIHGCAIGNSGDMLKTLSAAFGGADSEAPTVYAPKKLQKYSHTGDVSEESLMEYWAVGFPAADASKWDDKKLVKEFQSQHGVVPGIDWNKEIPKAHRGTDKMTQGVSFSFYVIPKKDDKAGHTRLLDNVKPGKLSTWTAWSVKDQQVKAQGLKDEVTITYSFKMGADEGTQPVSFIQERPPANKAEQEAAIKAEVGSDFDRYSWTYKQGKAGGAAAGDQDSVDLDAAGERTVVRVQRDLLGADNKPQHPSRTDASNYGSFAPPQPPPAKPVTTP